MTTDYEKYINEHGEKKILKIFGWFCIIFAIMGMINILYFLSWNSKKSNFTEQYVFSENGTLYYESYGEKIYVQDIYDTKNEKITLNVPNNQTIIMYMSKSNPNVGIYFDASNTIDTAMLNPYFNTVESLLMMILGLFFLLTYKQAHTKKITMAPAYCSFALFLFLGLGICLPQILNAINYIDLKSQNNITIATIYSEIYSHGGEDDMYKPVSYYYVDNQKYIYINEFYIDGSLDENIDSTFLIYYDKDNPKKVSKVEGAVDFNILLFGIMCLILPIGFTVIKLMSKVKELRSKKELLS